MASIRYPRIVIAGLSGDSGKTILTCGLAVALNKMGLTTAVYKKGPDYIDPMWLSLSSQSVVRNLDTYMMGREEIVRSFTINSFSKEISLIEGNRGLYDGLDSYGTHSTAELAKLLNAPVVLVINPRKVTRTISAYVLGCMHLDKDVNIQGVILNQITGRHLNIVKQSIENDTGMKVIGAIPPIKQSGILPSRHLGLITPLEYEKAQSAMDEIGLIIEQNVDLNKLIDISRQTLNLEYETSNEESISSEKIRIGYFYDKAFSFYYPENLEALEKAGAELVKISSFEDKQLTEIYGLYIGGGFPETNIKEICNNKELMKNLKKEVENGLPVYAECGGLIYLANSITIDDSKYELCKILPLDLQMHQKPQGHGYCEAIISRENSWFNIGDIIRGHEFHYSALKQFTSDIELIMNLERGTGIINNQDGLIYKNVFASYLHIHSNGASYWTHKFIDLARSYKTTLKN